MKKKVSVIDIEWYCKLDELEGLPSSADVVVPAEGDLEESVTHVLEDNFDGEVVDFRVLNEEKVPDDYEPTADELA